MYSRQYASLQRCKVRMRPWLHLSTSNSYRTLGARYEKVSLYILSKLLDKLHFESACRPEPVQPLYGRNFGVTAPACMRVHMPSASQLIYFALTSRISSPAMSAPDSAPQAAAVGLVGPASQAPVHIPSAPWLTSFTAIKSVLLPPFVRSLTRALQRLARACHHPQLLALLLCIRQAFFRQPVEQQCACGRHCTQAAGAWSTQR